MIRIGVIAMLALICAAAHAQVQTVDPRAVAEAAGAKPSTPAASDPPRLVQDASRGMNDADARQCLQLDTNTQIHRCAEQYRPASSRSGVVKTAQRASDGGTEAARVTK